MPNTTKRTSNRSGLISPVQEMFASIKGSPGRLFTPPHITTAFKLRNALETCVVLEPLNIGNVELEEVSSKTELPQTIIAFMGGTGTGKSSLINALLDSSCVLPTSDDRACTSVVVEVAQNIKKDMFEADVEFLQKNDWFKELQMLLEDLMSKDGSGLIKPPESSSDMYVSYCKVKAVYGKIDTFESLSNIESVNQWLGKTHHLACSGSEGEKFRDEVEEFIITNEHGKNTQSLWPIIKHVRIKLPHSDVCSSGASLVDLPGIGDSNPARNKIAKEFLKECHSVWMINAMTRAIDDVSSRDLLDHGLRRQFFMDGKMESLAFVCTMSDRFSEHNTIRTHELDSMCRDLTVQKSSMEMDKRHLEQKIKGSLDTEDVSKVKARIWELHENIMKTNYTISKICAKSRNEVCIRHIQRLFWNIKRQSSLISDHPDGGKSEHDAEVDMEDCEEDSFEEEAAERAIRVFCCSSTEYQKITGVNPADGPPVVFKDAEDTQIPALREYVHELTYVRRLKGIEHLVRSLGRCVCNFLSYLRNCGRLLDAAVSAGIEATIDEELCHFQEQMQSMIKTIEISLEDLFCGQIRCLVIEGAIHAKMDACTICDRWGPLVNKVPDRSQVVGLHWRSYRATVQRKGIFTIYSSKTDINFNDDLVDPIYKEIAIEWNRVFNAQLPQTLDKTSEEICNETRIFIDHLCEQVKLFPISEERVQNIKIQLKLSINVKLSEFLSQICLQVMHKQREINRILTPFIQFRMDDVYMDVANQTGTGSTENMKRCMREGIDKLRHTMFDDATEKLLGELDSLQRVILKVIASQCSDLQEEMIKAFEPVWKVNTPSASALYEVFSSACEGIREIYADANLENSDKVPHRDVSRSQVSPITCTEEQQEQHLKKQTTSRWEYNVRNILRNGTSDEIMTVLSTCPNFETTEVLRPFVNKYDIQRKLLLIITNLLHKQLLIQGYNVSVWPGYVPYKRDHVLFCTFTTEKPQVRRFFNMDLFYLDFNSLT
ncbi:hypothetical protein ACJMK2_006554 [Sinanodonta woodiana]|uniref:Uncharacterized protein n=1 Tax=Sinanodonta woodiana TaxID=1069815 RepID=A0ABD3VWB2_SINWO